MFMQLLGYFIVGTIALFMVTFVLTLMIVLFGKAKEQYRWDRKIFWRWVVLIAVFIPVAIVVGWWFAPFLQ